MDVELASDHLFVHAQIASGEDQGLWAYNLVSDQHLRSAAVSPINFPYYSRSEHQIQVGVALPSERRNAVTGLSICIMGRDRS